MYKMKKVLIPIDSIGIKLYNNKEIREEGEPYDDLNQGNICVAGYDRPCTA